MHDSLSSRHELEVSRADGALVACEIFMVDPAFQQVCDCLLSAVGVVGKARARWNAEVVEHQERCEMAEARRAD